MTPPRLHFEDVIDNFKKLSSPSRRACVHRIAPPLPPPPHNILGGAGVEFVQLTTLEEKHKVTLAVEQLLKYPFELDAKTGLGVRPQTGSACPPACLLAHCTLHTHSDHCTLPQ